MNHLSPLEFLIPNHSVVYFRLSAEVDHEKMNAQVLFLFYFYRTNLICKGKLLMANISTSSASLLHGLY